PHAPQEGTQSGTQIVPSQCVPNPQVSVQVPPHPSSPHAPQVGKQTQVSFSQRILLSQAH
ncbi:MAG: hypothetical protein WCS85_00005, partial [Candidatus Peribacteraceae bacterium]